MSKRGHAGRAEERRRRPPARRLRAPERPDGDAVAGAAVCGLTAVRQFLPAVIQVEVQEPGRSAREQDVPSTGDTLRTLARFGEGERGGEGESDNSSALWIRWPSCATFDSPSSASASCPPVERIRETPRDEPTCPLFLRAWLPHGRRAKSGQRTSKSRARSAGGARAPIRSNMHGRQ